MRSTRAPFRLFLVNSVLKNDTKTLRASLKVDFIVYAILIKDGRVVKTFHSGFASGRAPGRCITVSDYDMGKSSHAEVSALRWLDHTLRKTTKKESDIKRKAAKYSLFIYREDKRGNLVCAGPCSRCADIINRSGIKKVFHTVPGGYVRVDGRTIRGYTKVW